MFISMVVYLCGKSFNLLPSIRLDAGLVSFVLFHINYFTSFVNFAVTQSVHTSVPTIRALAAGWSNLVRFVTSFLGDGTEKTRDEGDGVGVWYTRYTGAGMQSTANSIFSVQTQPGECWTDHSPKVINQKSDRDFWLRVLWLECNEELRNKGERHGFIVQSNAFLC